MADSRVLVCLAKNDIDTTHFGNDDFENGKPFFDWFWENVLGLDSEEYRREFWREVYTTGHTIGHVPRGLEEFLREHTIVRSERTGILFMILCLMGCSFAFWVVRRQITLMLRRKRRGDYYEPERERRQKLAAERRAVTVRRTPNRAPTVAELREGFAHAAESPEASLRFGAMLQDLECYVDNHVLFDPETGVLRGRCGGIKRYLEREAHDLFVRYKTVMSHKARAKKFRQACDAIDPVPIDALLPIHTPVSPTGDFLATSGPQTSVPGRGGIPSPPVSGNGSMSGAGGNKFPPPSTTDGEALPGTSQERHVFRGMRFPDWSILREVESLSSWMWSNGNTDYLKTRKWVHDPVGKYDQTNLLRDDSQDLAAEMLAFCDDTLVSLDAAIALRIDPRFVREGVKPDPRVKVLKARPPVAKVKTSQRVVDWLTRRRASTPAA